jgi:hypothetical protein
MPKRQMEETRVEPEEARVEPEETRVRPLTLRELLRENPDSGQRVIGEGTVHLDPQRIRQSRGYRDIVARLRGLNMSDLSN